MTAPSTMTFTGPALPPLPREDILTWIWTDPVYPDDKPIYISANDPSRRLTRRDVHTLIRKLIAGWQHAGLVPGDCVLIHAFNDILYPVLVLSIIGAGGIYTGSNPGATATELTHQIRAASVRFVVSEPELLPAVTASGIPPDRVWIFHPLPTQHTPAGAKSWHTLQTHGETPWRPLSTTARTTTACRLFSSGTTGLPKAANLSHTNFIAQHLALWKAHDRHVDYEPTHILALPMFHAAAAPLSHFSLLKKGHTAYVLRRFELPLYLATLQRYKITEIGAVPAIIAALTVHGSPDIFRSVRRAAVGAAPLGAAAQAKFRTLLPESAAVVQVWGMTETSCVATVFGYPETDNTGSVGRLIPGLEAKLVDDAGRNITDYDTPGEMVVRGPTVFMGYQGAQEGAGGGGWYHTGDIMHCSRDGKWYITARKKELIKVRGFQVSPAEVEAVVEVVPGVRDVAVVGVGDVELVRAYVVAEGGVSEEEVVDAVKGRLAGYKQITGGVRFVEAIPRNAGGKIVRNVVKRWAEEEEAAGKSKL